MKKHILLLLMMAGLFATAVAQPGERFGDNMFLSLKGGMGMYSNRLNDNPTGFSGGISVGKWIVSPLAFRVSFDFMTIPNASTLHPYTSRFALGSAEFLWDFTSTFMRIRNWPVKFYPMLGLGVVFEGGDNGHRTDHEFQAMLGGQVNYIITPRWDVFLEYKLNFFPEAFDGSNGDVYLHSFLLGFSHQFTEGPFRRRTAAESRGVMEDWFFGAGIGPNFSSFTFEHMDKLGMYGAAPEIMFGRNYSNFWTIRFELNGLTAHERYDTINDEPGDGYTFSAFHTDVMVNLTHALKFSRGKKLNVLPYLGAGLAWRYDNAKFDMAADFGVMLRYYIGRRSDLYADFKYTMVTPRIAGGTGEPGPLPGMLGYDILWVGLPSITVGYIYNFGHNTTRYRLPAHWSPGGSCAD